MTQRTKGFVILAVVAALIGGVIGLGTALFDTSPQVVRASTVYEAPVGAVGPDAFSPSYATGQLPQSYEFELVSGDIAASSESLYVQPRGTYGGPGSNVCDKAGMKDFFQRHPDRGAAWARIQGIPFSEINSFIDGLNTAYLAQNVKLTMYGFKNGQEYGYEAIIAAGTAVLVDDDGLPRARCACGNPLVTKKPPEETTTTTEATTTTEPIEIEECPEGTTYYRDEEGNPVTPEPSIDEWVEIDTSETGFNPSPLDDSTEQSTDEWEPNYDLCAPECPEYTPEEGEYYDDSWRYEDGRWVPLFGDYSPIYDTRLLPGWTDDCGPCPPGDPGTYDAAPPTRRYEGEYYTWDFETEQWVDSNGEPGDLPGSDGAFDDPLDVNGDGIGPDFEQTLEDMLDDWYDPCAPECPPDYYNDVPTSTPGNDDSPRDSSNDSSESVPGDSNDSSTSESLDDSTTETYGDPCAPCPPDYTSDSSDNGDGYFSDDSYYNPYGDGYYSEYDPCSPCPPDYSSDSSDNGDGYYSDDSYYNRYNPCVPICPIDVYLSMLPTYFVDPSGIAWVFDSITGLWTPSNGGQPQVNPPSWIADIIDAYISLYDPNRPCERAPMCPNPAGTQVSTYVVDYEGVVWTWSAGKWYSPSG